MCSAEDGMYGVEVTPSGRFLFEGQKIWGEA